MSWPQGLPPELLRPVPRRVRLTAAGKLTLVLALLLAAAAAAAGIGLYLAAERDRLRLEQIRREAVRTEAEVVQTGITRGKNRERFVVYRYSAEGRLHSGRFTLGRRNGQGIQAGSRVTISYLPGDPARSWRVGREPAGVPLWAALVVPAGLGISAGAMGFALRRQRWLLAEGRAAPGRVTRSERLPGKSHGHRVHYQFALLSGARRSGSFDQMKAPPPPGSPVVVVYDPENPRRQRRYPFSLVRVAGPQEG